MPTDVTRGRDSRGAGAGCADDLVPLGAPAASAAIRSEFFGIEQGPGPTLDGTDMKAMRATRVHTVRYLFQWESVQPTKGSYRWGPQDNFIGRLASQGNPGRPDRLGKSEVGDRLHGARPDRPPEGPARLAGIPEGRGRAIRAERRLLAGALSRRLRAERHSASDLLLADLERAQPEEVLGPLSGPEEVRDACSSSPTARSRAWTRTLRSSSGDCPDTRARGSGRGSS